MVVRLVQALLGVVAAVRRDVIEQGTLEEIEKHLQDIARGVATTLLAEVALRLQEQHMRLVEVGICCPKCHQEFEFSQSGMMTFETHLAERKTSPHCSDIAAAMTAGA